MAFKKGIFGFCFFLAACGTAGKPQLKIYNWVGYIPDEIYSEFEEETGISIILDTIASNEELYAKVKGGGSVYDLIVPSMDYAQILVEEGLAAPLGNLPNLAHIDAEIMSKIEDIDPGHRFIAPFVYGPTVIAYDSEKITVPVKGFEIFENPAYKGRLTLLDDMREVMASALLLNGYSPGDASPAALKAAERQISRWQKNILRFDVDTFQKTIAEGETYAVHGYPETIWVFLSDKKKNTIKFVIPDKGGTAYLDSFIILKNSFNPEAAAQFINFVHRPDIYARICDALRLVCINIPARELVKEEPLVSFADLKRTELLKAVPDEVLAAQSRVWERLLAQ